MRKIHFIFLLISVMFCIKTTVNAQEILPVGTAKSLNEFKLSKTYVVLEQDVMSDYNLAIEKVMQQQWHATEFEFIRATEFQEMRKDKTKSFLYINSVYFEKDRTATAYSYLFLSMGHPSGKVDKMQDLCVVPLSVRGEAQDSYVYKLGLMLNFIQSHLALSEQHPGATDEEMLEFYSENKPDLSKYKLLLIKTELESKLQSSEELTKVYPFPYEFVDRDKIKETISNYAENTLVLHLVKAGENRFCVKFIADAATGRLVYFDYHKTSSRVASVLLKKDLKKLAK